MCKPLKCKSCATLIFSPLKLKQEKTVVPSNTDFRLIIHPCFIFIWSFTKGMLMITAYQPPISWLPLLWRIFCLTLWSYENNYFNMSDTNQISTLCLCLKDLLISTLAYNRTAAMIWQPLYYCYTKHAICQSKYQKMPCYYHCYYDNISMHFIFQEHRGFKLRINWIKEQDMNPIKVIWIIDVIYSRIY